MLTFDTLRQIRSALINLSQEQEREGLSANAHRTRELVKLVNQEIKETGAILAAAIDSGHLEIIAG